MNENDIARLLQNWAAVDEKHREDLLQRCLAVLGQNDGEAALDGLELDDSELDMVAAAGNMLVTGLSAESNRQD